MDRESVRERVGFELGRMARLWRARLDERLAPLGLTQARWVTLLYLSRGGDDPLQRDLAQGIGVEGPTLVRVLDGLERMGLIERRERAGDRRAKTVHLTAAASPVLKDIARVAAGLREEVLTGLSDDELAAFESVLLRMAANVGGRVKS